MAKKIKLEVSFDYENLTIFGINSQLPDYRLVWFLNKNLSLSLVKMDDFSFIPIKEEKPEIFAFFQYADEENFKKYYLLSNRSLNKYIISEFKSFNYLFIVKGKLSDVQKNNILKNISDIKHILLAQNLNLSKIKNFDIILNDFELFTSEIGSD